MNDEACTLTPTHKSENVSYHCRLIAQSNDTLHHENYPTGCRWAPDGTCILTATALDGNFRLYDTPFHQIKSANGDVCSHENDEGVDEPVENGVTAASDTEQRIKESGDESANHSGNDTNDAELSNQIYSWKTSLASHQGGPPPPSGSSSYSFYPLFNSSNPQTALYATCRGHSLPIHLIDAYTSGLRASYCPYNNFDELEGPTVVEFSPDGSRIYGTGFRSDRTIAVFDTSIPGREGQILRLGKTRRSADGQKGIPSAIAFPKCSGGDGPSNVFAVGTYSPASIYIYDDRMAYGAAGTIVLHGGLTVVGHGKAFSRKKRRFANTTDNSNENNENWFSSARVNWFQSQARGGVTQLTWAPPASSNPYILYSASRRSNAVLSWDVRMLSSNDKSTHPICGLKSFSRDGDTNQRIDFDLDNDGKKLYIGTGSNEGVVKIYDTVTSTLEYEMSIENKLSKHAVNGVSFLNIGSQKLLAVATGYRYFSDESGDEDDEDLAVLSPGYLQLYSIGSQDKENRTI